MIWSAEELARWPGNGRRPYDLATEKADYPIWSGSPHRSFLICTHQRSGSTLLGEAVYFAGSMGCPLEYFHRGFRPPFALRWNTGDIHSYIRAVYRFRTDTTGVLSVKLFWKDVEDILEELSPSHFEYLRDNPPASISPAVYRKIYELLAEIFPNPVFVYLTRRDRVRQAVSTLVAAQTKLWRSIPGVGEQSPSGVATYDYEQILSCLGFSDYCNAHWKNFLPAAGASAHSVFYEDLVREYVPTLRKVFEYLGCARQPALPRMHRQSNPASERMVLRFLKEYAERAPWAAPV